MPGVIRIEALVQAAEGQVARDEVMRGHDDRSGAGAFLRATPPLD
jgi:hypothetical protein